jgi:putative transposase
MLSFDHAYNEQHLHSGINFAMPAHRHQGVDVKLLARRKAVYERAKSLNPRRWSGGIRNWEAAGAVSFNPRKLSGMNRLLKRSYLDNWVANHR